MSRGGIVCVPLPSHVREAIDSPFNVPPGIESQGFCVLPKAP